MPLCDVLYTLFTDKHIPDCAPHCHEMAPLTSNDPSVAHRERFCRYTVTPTVKVVRFIPHDMTTGAADTLMKRCFLGQTFQGSMDKLTKHHATALFDGSLDESGPCIRPTKAKLVLMGRLIMQPGKYYKLE